MKRGSTVFLQIVIVILGVAVMTFMLAEPNFEGRNVHSTLFQVYFEDPFLAYMYVGSIPFFVALYQAFRILGYARRDQIFLERSVRALRIIKYCAIITAAFIVGAEAYMWAFIRGTDDIAGGVMMGLVIIFVSAVIATAAAVFERVLQSAVEIKSENDLTV